ncbi:MAG: lysophospholipid acyltransferase family protein [Patescibacteria group bacterium]|jgi:1-acyl-sn-glycerol-3-phosphate acyltransferase
MFYSLIKILFAPIIKFFWLGEIKGINNIPTKKSVILCANHTSYLDFLLLASVLSKKVYFLAAEVFFKSKIWYPLVKFTGQIRVDRNAEDKSKTYIGVDNILNRHDTLCLFPEGTRSRSGKLQKGYNGAVKFAYKYKVPIVPIGILGAFEAWPPQKKIPKIKKINLVFGEPYRVITDSFEYETSILMNKIAKLSNQNYKSNDKIL